LGNWRESSFLLKPIFFSMLISWAEILDLSHLALPRSVIFDSGVLCLVKRMRGGINGLGGEERESGGAPEAMGAMEELQRRSRDAARAKVLKEEDDGLM
jgi:hypothetical protein